MEREPRFTRGILHHADALERDRVAESGAHGLGKGLLRSKPIGHEQYWLYRPEISRPFQGCQHASRKALAILVEQARDTPWLHDVDPDTVNHRADPISAFISRTACAMPTNTD